MEQMMRYEHGIYAIDAHYVRPQLASIHLVVEKNRVAVVDTGSNRSLSFVQGALKKLGLTSECVDYVILTHVHLDHAGGAGSMMRAFPAAHLVVHPRGARHMIDPSKLVAGAADVYGKEALARLYGEILPIDAGRVQEAEHGFRIDLAGRDLLCINTPGHARHHICVVDSRSGNVFSGDTFGLSYRELDTAGRQFVFPTTTPVQFDPVALHASVDLILSYQPKVVYLTHYSELRDVDQRGVDLHRQIDAHLRIARAEAKAGSERLARIRAGLADLLLDEAKRFGCCLPAGRILDVYSGDLDLNAQGLAVWLDGNN